MQIAGCQIKFFLTFQKQKPAPATTPATLKIRYEQLFIFQKVRTCGTRMHSSRVRTARSLPYPEVYLDRDPRFPEDGDPQRSPDRDPLDGDPYWTEPHPPPGKEIPWTGNDIIQTTPVDRQTPVKILPCPKLRLRAVKIKENV